MRPIVTSIWYNFLSEARHADSRLDPRSGVDVLTLAAYSAGSEKVAYVENVAVGDRLADMPIFLTPDHYVPCPLEASYGVTWGVFPAALKGPLELSTK